MGKWISEDVEIFECIGRGGMGEVYRGRIRGAVGFKKDVAVKLILPHLSDDENFRSRFIKEANLLSNLNHPNIVHIFQTGEFDGRLFSILEYVDGQTLREILDQLEGKTLPEPQALAIINELSSALRYAFDFRTDQTSQENLLHRDLAPHNVMITKDGRVKLIDFGLAKLVASDQSNSTRKTLLGRISYTAPEIFSGNGHSQASDIFALGVISIELLTGKNPFRGDNEAHTVNLIQRAHNVDIDLLLEKYGVELKEVVTGLVSFDPEQRKKAFERLIQRQFRLVDSQNFNSSHAKKLSSDISIARWIMSVRAIPNLFIALSSAVYAASFYCILFQNQSLLDKSIKSIVADSNRDGEIDDSHLYWFDQARTKELTQQSEYVIERFKNTLDSSACVLIALKASKLIGYVDNAGTPTQSSIRNFKFNEINTVKARSLIELTNHFCSGVPFFQHVRYVTLRLLEPLPANGAARPGIRYILEEFYENRSSEMDKKIDDLAIGGYNMFLRDSTNKGRWLTNTNTPNFSFFETFIIKGTDGKQIDPILFDDRGCHGFGDFLFALKLTVDWERGELTEIPNFSILFLPPRSQLMSGLYTIDLNGKKFPAFQINASDPIFVSGLCHYRRIKGVLTKVSSWRPKI